MNKIKKILKNIISIPFRVFSKISVFAIIQDSVVDKEAAICMGTKFYRSKIGRMSYVGSSSIVVNTTIGAFTSIGASVYIGAEAHPLNWFSTSPVFYGERNVFNKNLTDYKFKESDETYIGNDVWIGTKVLIKSGVRISNGSVIGMGSVVTKDIGPYEIWGGNPARKIRMRFEPEIIQKLEDSKWWDKDISLLSQAAKISPDPEVFVEKIKKI